MASGPLSRLIEQAREDPQFFHELVFNTENVLANLDYLDRTARGNLLAASPEEVVSGLVGGRVTGVGGLPLAGCDVTCTSSCGATCNDSCGYTTNLQDPGNFVRFSRFGGRF